MSIVYYPSRVFKGVVPAVDREMAQRNPQILNGSQDISVTALDFEFSSPKNWQIDSVAFSFSNNTARNYSFGIKNGRKVVTNLNDYLWFHSSETAPQKITLSPDFYTGTQLAAQLQTQLNANAAFVAAGITFTVIYTAATGIFQVTPSTGTIKYLSVNNAQTLSNRDSIAGHLFGLTANTNFAASVSSDTAVRGINSEAFIISETASVVLDRYHDDMHILSMDQAIHLTTSVANLSVVYTVVYEEIV